MGTKDDTTDEPTNEQRHRVTESVADVEPPSEFLDEFPDWRAPVDVVIPLEVARAIAYRAGESVTGGDSVTESKIYDLAYGHAQVTERFLVPNGAGPHTRLVEWVEQQGVPVDRADGERAGDHVTDESITVFTATAEYRPGEEIPLVVSLDVPEHVLEAAGGWGELTETARLTRAGDQGAVGPAGDR